MCDNELTTIPAAIGSLTRLVKLDASRNCKSKKVSSFFFLCINASTSLWPPRSHSLLNYSSSRSRPFGSIPSCQFSIFWIYLNIFGCLLWRTFLCCDLRLRCDLWICDRNTRYVEIAIFQNWSQLKIGFFSFFYPLAVSSRFSCPDWHDIAIDNCHLSLFILLMRMYFKGQHSIQYMWKRILGWLLIKEEKYIE